MMPTISGTVRMRLYSGLHPGVKSIRPPARLERRAKGGGGVMSFARVQRVPDRRGDRGGGS